jgi:hypothetical protein
VSSRQLFLSVFASFAFQTHEPALCLLFPSLLVCQRKDEPFNPIKLVLADFSGLQERQSWICDKMI